MTQVNNHKSTGHTSLLNADVLSNSDEELRKQAQRSLLLNRITTQPDQDYDLQITNALTLIRKAFEFDLAIISRIVGQDYHIQHISYTEGNIEKDQIFELRQTYCEEVHRTNDVLAINHASNSPYADHACYKASHIESYLGAPVHVNKQRYGTIALSNFEPRPVPFTDLDLEFVQIFANWVGGLLSRQKAAVDLQSTIDGMTQLYQYTAILNQATSVEELFFTAIQPSIEAGATFANLFTIQVNHNNQPEFADMVTSWSASGATPLPAGTRLKLADFEISKYWIATRKPIFIGNIETDERLTDAAREVYHQVNAKSTITYPLIMQDKWVGVISLNWPETRIFTDADRQQYETMSNQTAAVLHNLLNSEQESKRAQALETVSQVSAAVSSILDVPELLQTVVNLTKEQFNLYHAHLYLKDSGQNQLRLASGAGEIGKQMVDEGRTIPLDAQQSLVARAARSTSGFIVNDVANEIGFLPHPLLPNTASELAVPIISGQEMLGVLDVQAAQINYFSQDDLDILNTLAAQIAPALQNARAFAQLRTARAESQKAQDRTEAILKSTTLPLVITRISDGLALYANEPLSDIIRIPLDQITGKKSPDFYASPEERQQFLQTLMANGYVENYELEIVRNDDTRFWALVSARLFDYEGQSAIVSTLADITDRKETQQRVETILTSVNLPLAITRISDGYGMYANEPFAEVFRLPVAEFIGRQSPDFYANPADRAGLLAGVREVGYTRNYETQLKRNDGTVFWALMSARAIDYEGHESIMTTIIDISDRKEASEALSRSQEDLTTIVEYSQEAIGFVNTATGLFENLNSRAIELFDLLPEEVGNVGPSDVSPEVQPEGIPSEEKAMKYLGEAIQGGSPVIEWTHINKKGELIPCEVRLSGLTGDRSHLVRFSTTDISERKALEDELRLLQQAFNASTQPITIADMRQDDQPLIYVNPAFEQKTGYSREEIIGRNCRFLQSDDNDQEGLTTIRQALKNGEPCDVEIRNYRKDGTLFWNRLVLSPVKNAAGQVTHFIGSQNDITARKELEEELTLLKQAMDASTQPITIADMRQEDQPLIYVNPAFEVKTGYTVAEALNNNCRFLQRDDTDQEGLTILRKAIKAGEPCDVELRNYRKDGSLFWNRLVLSPVTNAAGEVTHFIGSQQDITEQKEVSVRLAKQAADLATVAEVSTAVSTIQNTDEMLQTVVELTKERFNLYHAHIFLLDEQTQELVLTAGAGKVGREMVAEGRHIPLSAEGSLVAAVGRNRAGQIRNYEEEMEGFAPHPALIDTRTELAVPLVVGNELVGVLDVRSEESHAFSEADVQVQSTLASQIAVSLQNARSFETAKQAQEELRANQSQLEAILDNLPVGVFVADAQTGIPQLANTAALDLLGRGLDPDSGTAGYTEVYQTYVVDGDEPLATEALPLVQTMTTGEINQGQLDIMRPDDRITVDVTAVPIFDEDNTMTSAIALFQDITERRQSEAELVLQNTAIDAAATGIAILDRGGRFIRVNTAFTELTGYEPKEAIGQTARILKSGKQSDEFYKEMWKTILAGEVWQDELINKRKDGTLYTEEMTITPVRASGNEITHFIAIKQDVTERQKAAEATAKQAAELGTVAQIGIAISSSLDTQSLLQEVVDLTKENFNLYHAHIYLFDEAGQNLTLASGAGSVGKKMVQQSRSIPLNAPSIVAQAARNGQAVIANNVLQDPSFLPNPLLPKTRSEVAIPLIFGGAVLGVLDVQSSRVNHFTEQDLNIQTTLATEIAVALENARQYEETQKANEEVSRLYNISQVINTATTPQTLLDGLMESLDMQAPARGTLFNIIVSSQNTPQAIRQLSQWVADKIYSSPFSNGTVFPVIQSGLAQHWTETGRVVLVNNVDTDNRLDDTDRTIFKEAGTKATVILPLKIGEDWIGLINPGWTTPQSFTDKDRRLFQSLADQMAVALNSYNLLNQTQERATQMQVVSEVGTTVSSLQDSTEMLQTVVDLTKERFELYHAHAFLFDRIRNELVLTAGAGEIGREMVAEGRVIPYAAEGSLVATAARKRLPQIRNYEGEMEGYAPHPALIDTRTEMAVPLIVGNQLLGILDIRSEQDNAFGEIDAQVQSTLASQVAIALQNAQQYEETQNALGRLQQANAVVQNSPAILFRWDALNDYAVEIVSDNIARFGYTPAELLSGEIDYATNIVHPDDLPEVLAEIDKYLEDDPNIAGFNQEYRIITKEGEIRWVDDRTTVIRDDERNVTHLEGVVIDSTDRRLAEAETARRAQELATVAEVSTAVSSLQDSQEMLQTVVDLTKDRFDLYHAHAFLMDDAGETLILTAGAGDVGREMVAEGRRIPYAAEGSLVATAARTRQAQIRNYEGEMEGYAPHPALIDTRTEMAIPLLAGDELLGVLDIRSIKDNAFGQIDIQIQSTLASQVAIALENARQFEETERARRELSVITSRLTREGWQEFLTDRSDEVLRYGYNLQTTQLLSEESFSFMETNAAVSAPLVVQDTKLGQLAVELIDEPDEDTADVIKSVVSNLSAHIETIRLNEQTFKALANTESLYTAISQIVRADTTTDILNSLIESTVMNQMDRANLFMFNRPWDDVEPEYVIVDALWERGRDASQSPAPSGTIYYVNQITTIQSFKRDQVVIYQDILTDERVDPISRQNLSTLGTRSLFVFPLVVNQQWIGAVTAQSSDADYQISENNLRQIQTLTEQAATTIANRRLLIQAQKRAERERQVRAITDRIRNGTTREDILKIAREEIGNLLGTQNSVVQLGTKQQLLSKLNRSNGHD